MSSFEEQFPPFAYIIGAQKSGTTGLARYLEKNPQICVAKPKEPDYFSGQWQRGEAWYRERFSPTSMTKVLLDASTSYSMAPIGGIPENSGFSHVPERIHACRPQAKFVYVMRDPVERAYSGYWHAVRAGHESRPLKDAISQHSGYIRGSRYPEQIESYLAYFPIESILFVEFRSFIRDPVSIVQRIERHIGVEPHPVQIESRKTNESFLFNQTGSMLMNAVGGQQKFRKIVAAAKRVLPSSLMAGIKRRLVDPIPTMDRDSWTHIYAFLVETYPKTHSLTGIRFEPKPPAAT